MPKTLLRYIAIRIAIALCALTIGYLVAIQLHRPPQCIPCSWVPPYGNCVPSACWRRPDGEMCCVKAGPIEGAIK